MASATPAAPSGTLDFGRSFTFMTEDPDWLKKVLIGGAFTLAAAVARGRPVRARLLSRARCATWRPARRAAAAGVGRPGRDLRRGPPPHGRVPGPRARRARGRRCSSAASLLLPAALGRARTTRGARSAPSAGSRSCGALRPRDGRRRWRSAVYLPAALVRVGARRSVGGAGSSGAHNLDFIRANLGELPLALVELPGRRASSRSSGSCSAAWASSRRPSGATWCWRSRSARPSASARDAGSS